MQRKIHLSLVLAIWQYLPFQSAHSYLCLYLKYRWSSNKTRCHLPRKTINRAIKCRLQQDR